MRPNPRIPIHALAMAAACALSSPAATAQPAPGAPVVTHESVTGTIWRIDSRAGALDLLTGVGHSVRVRRVRFSAGLEVKARGAGVGIAALVPGTVCRVDCEVASSGANATGVEVLYPAPARTP